MVKFFKIIEKIVWAIAILAIVAVMVLISIGAFAKFDKVQIDWSYYISYFYGAAAVVGLYKMAILYFTSNYQTEIEIKTEMLATLVDAQKDLCIPLNKKLRNAELKQFVTNIKGIIKKKILMQSHSFKPHLENGLVERKRILQRIIPYCLRIL